MTHMPSPQSEISDFQIPALGHISTPRAVGVILLVSAIAFAFLVWIIYLKHAPGSGSRAVNALPAVNASLNTLSTLFLVNGFLQIRRRNYARHMRFMFAAFLSSTLFLICYIIYHNIHGDTKFVAAGLVRPVYFAILISHITLSAVALPLILTSFFLSLSGRFKIHKRVSRYTFPIWLYVSVTGVLVFVMLKFLNA
jgi:putative membrane protein